MADDVAERSSELWFWRTLVYLDEKQHDKRKQRTGDEPLPAPKPDPAEVDEEGNWFIGLAETEGASGAAGG